MRIKHTIKQFFILLISIVCIFIGASCMIQNSQSAEDDNSSILDDNTKSQNSSTTKDRIDITATEKFSLSDYRWGITEFPANEVLSKIESSQDLIEKGKQLWREKLNFTPSKDYIIKTYYDDKNDCWMVTAEIEDIETDYAIPTAIIYTNGIVAAVWRE